MSIEFKVKKNILVRERIIDNLSSLFGRYSNDVHPTRTVSGPGWKVKGGNTGFSIRHHSLYMVVTVPTEEVKIQLLITVDDIVELDT